MSEALADTCDVDALLSEVVALDMALLRHVNAQALETTDPDTLNGFVRSQQRLARSVRTTLATRARLAREGREEIRRAAPQAGAPEAAYRPDPEQLALEAAVEARVRLEYDRADAEEIDEDIGLLVEDAREDPDLRSHDERLEAVMAAIRESFGPPTRPSPEAAPDPAPDPTPPPAPAEPAPEPPPPSLPPWERRPRHAIDKGGGSGW